MQVFKAFQKYFTKNLSNLVETVFISETVRLAEYFNELKSKGH
jgi:hypothetical protein